MHERLARAKQYLAIAESDNPRREAYIQAAEEIAAYKEETGDTNQNIAIFLGKSPDAVSKLLRWRKTGYEADTPWLMDEEATQRAARSHTRTVLSDPEERRLVLAELSPEMAMEVVETVTEREDVVPTVDAMKKEMAKLKPAQRAKVIRESFDKTAARALARDEKSAAVLDEVADEEYQAEYGDRPHPAAGGRRTLNEPHQETMLVWDRLHTAIRYILEAHSAWKGEPVDAWGALWAKDGEETVAHRLDQIYAAIGQLTIIRDYGQAFCDQHNIEAKDTWRRV